MHAPQRILIPTDFSAPATAALQYGKILANAFGSTLLVLHVMDDPLPGFKMPDHVCSIEPLRKQIEREAAEHLAGLLTPEERQKYKAETTAEWGNPYAKVLEFAKDHHVDLIVMGTDGRGALGHLLLGNVAERVVRMATCPVVTLHAD